MQDGFRTARRFGAVYFGTFVAAGVAATALFGFAGQAAAAGFALKEQSATALGNAFAGATAGADDVSYMFFNPAGLTLQEGNQAAAVLSYVAPTVDLKSVNGSPASGDAGANAWVPAAYLLWSNSADLKFALAVNSPLGLKTEYPLGWAGDLHAVESDIKSVNINPTVAYRLNQNLSIGAGIQIEYMDVKLSQDANNTDTLGEVTGNDWGFGATLGVLYEPSDSTRMGLGYRSQVSHTLKGDLKVGGSLVTSTSADFTAPDFITAGIYHQLSDQFAVMAEVDWTRWSNFDKLRIENGAGGLISQTPENWDDVWFFALGATWKPNSQWTLRGGVAYDQSPVPNAFRTPRLPDEDRTWISIGGQYAPSANFSLNFGYAHLFASNPLVNLPAGYTTPGLPALTARYDASIDILTAQATFRF